MAQYPCYKYYAKVVVDKVHDLLHQDTEQIPVISIFKQVRKILKEEHISYMLVNVHSKLLMVHFRNRGGLLVNAFNCHKNGAKVSLYGGDRAELHSAVAIELSADPTKRKERLIVIDVFKI